MSKKTIVLIIASCVACFVLPVGAFFAINGEDLKEAMRIDKSSGKLLYMYVPC